LRIASRCSFGRECIKIIVRTKAEAVPSRHLPTDS
jgi:hypothetical protein